MASEKPLRHSQVEPYRFRDLVGSTQNLEDALMGAKMAGASAGDRVAILSDIAASGGIASGINLMSNGDFTDGLTNWENSAPEPLTGAPLEEAKETVVVGTGLCGSACGPLIGCRTLQVSVLPCSRVCFFSVAKQNVCGGILCGGEFLLIEDVCIVRGEDILVPEILLDLYVSCKYVGTRRIVLYEPPLALPDKKGITIEDGLVRLSKRVELPHCIDEAVVTLQFVVIPRGSEDAYFRRRGGYCDYAFQRPCCEVGEQGLEFHLGAVQLRRVTVPERERDPGMDCKTNKIPMIESAESDGKVHYTPAYNQVATIIERLEEKCIPIL